MITTASLEAWMVETLELEAENPHLGNPSADLKKSQVYLSSVTSFVIIAIHMILPSNLHH
jgi:hypothetical protein